MEKAAVLFPFKFSKWKRSVLTACKTMIALSRYLNHLRISPSSFCLNSCQTRIKLQRFGQYSGTKLFVEYIQPVTLKHVCLTAIQMCTVQVGQLVGYQLVVSTFLQSDNIYIYMYTYIHSVREEVRHP